MQLGDWANQCSGILGCNSALPCRMQDAHALSADDLSTLWYGANTRQLSLLHLKMRSLRYMSHLDAVASSGAAVSTCV
jgi:hypothetical protein